MPNFVEVCAGCGGLGSGFIMAGFQPVLINEIDEACCATLRANHPDHASKVKQCSMEELSLRGLEVDALVGGVPCQAFSQSGGRRGFEDPRGRLILSFNRLVTEARPKAFLVENVRGLATHNKGKTLESVLELFENGGMYRLHHRIVSALDHGVPQKRERMIIVGVRGDIERDYSFPQPSGRMVTLGEAISGAAGGEGLEYPEKKRRVMDLVPEGGCWVNLPEGTRRAYMGKALESGGGRTGFARRLSMDRPSPTLMTNPSQKQTELCHPKETRPLNVREYARIQTFPDHYEFCGTTMQKYRQIGNAVPVNMARALAESLLAVL